MSWVRRLLNLVRSDRLSSDLDREMAFHLAERADALEAGGMSRHEAEREALKRFGHRNTLKERTRDVDVLVWLESLGADLRYALRSLKANPGFTLVAILSLGLGIGANTAIFSLVNAVILRVLPVERPEELVQVAVGESQYFTNPIWEALRDTPGMDDYFAYGGEPFNLATGGEVRSVQGAWVSGSYFPVLGVRALAGRLLQPDDDRRGCPATTVVSAGFAAREFGSAPAAFGRTMTLEGHPYQIIGVTEPRFFGTEVGQAVAAYVPLCSMDLMLGNRSYLDRRSTWFLEIMGRVVGPVETEAARLGAASPGIFAATIPTNWARNEQAEYAESKLTATTAAAGNSGLRTQYRSALVVLLVVVGTVLLIGCANVANLLLARSAARQHELAVRLAIGAGRGRLVRQLLTETLLLSFAGAAAGLLFARWASGLLVRFLSTRTSSVFVDLTLDTGVLLFSFAVAAVTGLLFGLAPAWRVSRVDPQSAMKAQGRGITAGSNRFALGRLLVVGQVALSLVLVVTAGLLVGSFRKLVTMDPGFRRENVVLVSMNLAGTRWPVEQRRTTHRQILERLRTLPGIEAVAASYTTPLGNSSWNDVIAVPGYSPPTMQDSVVMFNSVSEGWFSTLGTDLVAGRDFEASDGRSGARVAVINETTARRFFRHPAPLGRRFQIRNADSLGTPIEVVGVVRDAKYQSLREDNPPTAYVPLDQGEWYGTSVNYQLRTSTPPSGLVPVITGLAAGVSPSISLEFNTLSEQVGATLRRPRLLATLSGFFGALALILAVVGLYGIVAYGVACRRGEIGIRLALGAARTRVLGMVLGEAGKLLLVGLLVGMAAAVATTRLLQSFLYGLRPTDPVTLATSAAVLLSVALLASVVPAWRAASLDPTETLREE